MSWDLEALFTISQAFLMVSEKPVMRHLANSLIKTLSEELTKKMASFLADVKKQTETGWI